MSLTRSEPINNKSGDKTDESTMYHFTDNIRSAS